jgi:hypothetical protein
MSNTIYYMSILYSPNKQPYTQYLVLDGIGKMSKTSLFFVVHFLLLTSNPISAFDIFNDDHEDDIGGFYLDISSSESTKSNQQSSGP